MDAWAHALIAAAAILEQSDLPKMVERRYQSFDSGAGKDFEEGKLSLEQIVAYAKDKNAEPVQASGQQELYETIVSLYL
jgi:xylose isomerase